MAEEEAPPPPIEDEQEEAAAGGGWIVSYADLMTLLFAAFVVLYGIKPEGETKKILGVTSSIREAFVEVPDEIPDEKREGPILEGVAVFKYFKGDHPHEPIMKRYRRASYTINVINKDIDRVKNVIDMLSAKKSLSNKLKKATNQGPISVHREPDGFRVRLSATFFYDKGSYRIKQKHLKKLRNLGLLLKEINQNVMVEGHAGHSGDSTISKWKLSALRATYVAKYFIDDLNLLPKQVSAAGYGDSKPLTAGQTKYQQKMNRRIDLKIRYKEPTIEE